MSKVGRFAVWCPKRAYFLNIEVCKTNDCGSYDDCEEREHAEMRYLLNEGKTKMVKKVRRGALS